MKRRGALALIAAVALLATIASGIGVETTADQPAAAVGGSNLELQLHEVDAENEGVVDASPRPVYRHSVIPGGVYSASELAEALEADTVAREHYETVALDRVAVKKVAVPSDVYVSYRVGDRIYWTKGTVRLADGETVLTDGDVFVRARCGNRISTIPRTPVSDQEPPSVDEVIPRPGGFDLTVTFPELPGLVLPPVAGGTPTFDPGLLSPPPWATGSSTWGGPSFIGAIPGSVSSPGSLGANPQEPTIPLSGPFSAPVLVPPSPGPDEDSRGEDDSKTGGGNHPPSVIDDIPTDGDQGETTPENPAPSDQPLSVPEPSTFVLVGAGAAIVLIRRFTR